MRWKRGAPPAAERVVDVLEQGSGEMKEKKRRRRRNDDGRQLSDEVEGPHQQQSRS